MPRHCLEEVTGYRIVKWVGMLQLATVVVAGYTALTACVYVAKRD